MKREDRLLQEIARLRPAFSFDLFYTLLWIRLASPDFSPCGPQISLWHADRSETPWSLVAENRGGTFQQSIQQALLAMGRREDPPIPLSCGEEALLPRLIDLLSHLDPGDEPAAGADIWEQFLKRESAGPDGAFYTPGAIARLMADLADTGGGRICDPCCGSGALLAAAADRLGKAVPFSLYGQSLTERDLRLCQMGLSLRDLPGVTSSAGAHTLAADDFPQERFDCILANPPFNLSGRGKHLWREGDRRWIFGPPPRSNANFAWLQHVVCHLEDRGRAAVIMPNSTLTSGIRRERQIRSGFVDSGILEAIVTFPGKLFSSTEVPFCLWLLSRQARPEREVLLIDAARLEPPIRGELLPGHASEIRRLLDAFRQGKLSGSGKHYAVVSTGEIAAQDYMLSPNLYLKPDFHLTVGGDESGFRAALAAVLALPAGEPLLRALEPWRSPPAPGPWHRYGLLDLYESATGVNKSKADFGRGVPLLDTRTVVRSPFVPDKLDRFVSLSARELDKYRIRGGDVFLNRTSETADALACCCVAAEDMQAVYGGYLKRLRPKGRVFLHPGYAAGYFRSGIFRREIAGITPVRTTRISLNDSLLARTAFFCPCEETQRRIGEALYALFLERTHCREAARRDLLDNLAAALIEQFITVPIARLFDFEIEVASS